MNEDWGKRGGGGEHDRGRKKKKERWTYFFTLINQVGEKKGQLGREAGSFIAEKGGGEEHQG